MKLKTYVIMISRTFPAYHPRKGQETYFVEKILASFKSIRHPLDYIPKLHTIRANYDLWEKRMKEVQEGKAVISLRYHTLGRYVKGNKQIEFARLDKDSGCGVQKVNFGLETSMPFIDDRDNYIDAGILSINDGLLFVDFDYWFKLYKLDKPMAIIHFTKFRY
jgi:hypothetical protein